MCVRIKKTVRYPRKVYSRGTKSKMNTVDNWDLTNVFRRTFTTGTHHL